MFAATAVLTPARAGAVSAVKYSIVLKVAATNITRYILTQQFFLHEYYVMLIAAAKKQHFFVTI